MSILRREVNTRTSPPDSIAAARWEATRRGILDAATGVFAESGFDSTKMAGVAATAGVSLKTLYAAFDGKEALFEAVIADLFEQHVVPVLEAAREEDHPGEQVLALVEGVLESMELDRSFFLLYARGSDGVPTSLRAQGRDPYAPYVERFQERLVTLVAGAGSDLDPRDLASALAASVIALARVAVGAQPPRPITDVRDAVRSIFGPVLGLRA